MKFRNPYDAREPSKGFTCKTPSRTLQSETYATTIDYYLKKYAASGVLGDPSKINRAMYGDFTGLGDFQAMQEKINNVKNYFNTLPSDIRDKFGNNVNEFVSFVNNPANESQCYQLGIFVKSPELVAKEEAEHLAKNAAEIAKADAAAAAVKSSPSAEKATS